MGRGTITAARSSDRSGSGSGSASPSKDTLGSGVPGAVVGGVQTRVRVCMAALHKGGTATLRDPPLLQASLVAPAAPLLGGGRLVSAPVSLLRRAHSGTGLEASAARRLRGRARRGHQAAAPRPLQYPARRGGRPPRRSLGGGARIPVWSRLVARKGSQVRNRGGQAATLPRISHLHSKAQEGSAQGQHLRGASLHCSLGSRACRPSAGGQRQAPSLTALSAGCGLHGVSSPGPAGQGGARV